MHVMPFSSNYACSTTRCFSSKCSTTDLTWLGILNHMTWDGAS